MSILDKVGRLVGSVARSVHRGFTDPGVPRRRQQPVTATAAPPRQGSPDVMGWARRQVEKIRAGVASGRVRQLPNLDNYTGETPEVRSSLRLMLREPTIKAGLSTMVLAVAGQEPQTHPGEDSNDPRQVQAAEFGLYALNRLRGGPRSLAWSVLWHGCIDGSSVGEIVWEPDPVKWGRWAGKRTWRQVKAKDGMVAMTDEFLNITGFRGGAGNNGVVYPPENFVHFAHMPMFESPGGMSALRAAYRAYRDKALVMDLWGLNLDKFAGPYFKGTYADETQKDALQEAMEEARSHTFVTVPVGTLIEAMQVAINTGDFKEAIDRYDREMLIGTVGAYLHILEGQVSNGRGDTGIAKETSELFQWMLSASLADVVTGQMMPELTRVNFGDVPPPVVTWGAISEQVLMQRANVDKALVEMGFPLDVDEAAAYYGRKVATDPAKRLGVAPAPAASAGFPRAAGA